MRRILIIAILLLLCRSQLPAQCCRTKSLVINTGYNPLTGAVVASGTNCGTPVFDPKWTVTYTSPDINTMTTYGCATVSAGAANVIQPIGWVTNATSNWISCMNSNVFSTAGTSVCNKYEMILSRAFTLCKDDDVTLNLNVAADNYIASITIDRIPTGFTQGCSATTVNYSTFASLASAPVHLAAGTHFINVTLDNYDKSYQEPTNPCGLNIYGTVNSMNNSIVQETGACSSYTCASLQFGGPISICVGSTATFSFGETGGTWAISPSSVANITSVHTSGGTSYCDVSASGPGTAVLTYTDICGDVNTYTISVVSPCIATLIPPYSICGGPDTRNVDAGSTPGGVWSCSPSSIATVDASGNVTTVPGAIGTAIVTYSITNACGTATATTTVTVSPAPVFTLSAPTAVCSGNMFTINSTITSGGTMPLTYSWGPPPISGTLPYLNRYEYTSTMVVKNYTLDITNAYNCTTSQSISVEIDPVPDAGAIIGPSVVCSGDVVTLSNPTYSGGTASWYFTGPYGGYFGTVDPFTGSVINGSTGVINVGSVSTPTTMYIVFEVSNAGCPPAKVTFMITVKPLGIATANLVPSSCNPVCPGSTMLIQICGTAGSTVYYNYRFPTSPASPYHTGSIVMPSTPSFPCVTLPIPGPGVTGVPGTFEFNITSVDLNGCINMGTGNSLTQELDWPTATFGNIAQPGCPGDPICFTITGTPNSDVNIDNGTITRIVHIGPGGSATTCIPLWGTTTFTIGNVVTSCCSHYIGSSITLTPLPGATYALTASPNPACPGDKIILTATVVSGVPSPPFIWEGPIGSTTGGISYSTSTYTFTATPYALPNDAGTYTFKDLNEQCPSMATVDVNVLPTPTASMTCTPGCGTASLTVTGTPGSTVYYDGYPGPISGSVVLDAFGNGSTSVGISGTTTFYIPSVTGPAPTFCSSLMSYAGCVVTPTSYPGTAPTVVANISVSPFQYDITVPPIAMVPDCEYSLTYRIHITYGSIADCWVTLVQHYYASAGISFSIPVTMAGTLGAGCMPPGIVGTGIVEVDLLSISGCGCEWALDASAEAKGYAGEGNTKATMSTPEIDLSIIPNPNGGTFTLAGKYPGSPSVSEMRVEIMDMLSKTVYSDAVKVENESIYKQIALDKGVPNGVYFVKISAGNVSKVIKFTLNR